MSVIAERLSVVARTITDVVDGAEAAGVVARLADPADRRSILVKLTPAGRHLLAQLDLARRESAERVFGGLTEPQRNQLLDLLRVIGPADDGRAAGSAGGDSPTSPTPTVMPAATEPNR